MQTGKTILITLICAALLGACGNKGPLYLPDEKPASRQTPAADSDSDKEKAPRKKDGSTSRP